jgi:hypothetical protein
MQEIKAMVSEPRSQIPKVNVGNKWDEAEIGVCSVVLKLAFLKRPHDPPQKDTKESQSH